MFERSLFDLGETPKIRGQELGSGLKSAEDGLQTVTSGLGATSGRGIAILDTSELQDLLGLGLSDNTGTSGSGNKSNSNGTSFTSHLGRHGMGATDFISPITFSHGGDVQLGVDDSTFNGTLHFLVALGTESDVAFTVTDQDHGLESGSLSGSGHFLHGFESHDFFFELVFEEIVDDLGLFDWDGEFENFFKRLDFSVLDETAEFGNGLPLVELVPGASSLVLSALAAETTASSSFASFVVSLLFSHQFFN